MLLSFASIKGDPTTIGALADANSKKLGTYEKEAKMREDGSEAVNQHKKKLNKNYTLANMTPQQKDTYIREGRMP